MINDTENVPINYCTFNLNIIEAQNILMSNCIVFIKLKIHTLYTNIPCILFLRIHP